MNLSHSEFIPESAMMDRFALDHLTEGVLYLRSSNQIILEYINDAALGILNTHACNWLDAFVSPSSFLAAVTDCCKSQVKKQDTFEIRQYNFVNCKFFPFNEQQIFVQLQICDHKYASAQLFSKFNGVAVSLMEYHPDVRVRV